MIDEALYRKDTDNLLRSFIEVSKEQIPDIINGYKVSTKIRFHDSTHTYIDCEVSAVSSSGDEIQYAFGRGLFDLRSMYNTKGTIEPSSAKDFFLAKAKRELESLLKEFLLKLIHSINIRSRSENSEALGIK